MLKSTFRRATTGLTDGSPEVETEISLFEAIPRPILAGMNMVKQKIQEANRLLDELQIDVWLPAVCDTSTDEARFLRPRQFDLRAI